MALSSRKGYPESCDGLLQGSALSLLTERLHTGLGQKEEAVESSLSWFSLWFGVGSCDNLSVAALVSGIPKRPKNNVPEEGNVLFCRVKQWRGL